MELKKILKICDKEHTLSFRDLILKICDEVFKNWFSINGLQ